MFVRSSPRYLVDINGHSWYLMSIMPKAEKKLNRQVTFLDDEQMARLRQISAKTGAPISTLIRMSVAEFLKAKKKN